MHLRPTKRTILSRENGGLNHTVGYRGTLVTGKRTPLGPYRRPMSRVLGGSRGGGRFLMGEVPLYSNHPEACDRMGTQHMASVTEVTRN